MIILIHTENVFKNNSAPVYDKTSQSSQEHRDLLQFGYGPLQKFGANIIINGKIVKVVPLRWDQGKDSQLQCF